MARLTFEQLAYVVLFFLTVSGALWGIWWRIQGQIDKVKAEAISNAESVRRDTLASADAARAIASLAQMNLAEHKLHVAETYVTKAGLRESTEHIMSAIDGVQRSVEGVAGRLDRVFEARNERNGAQQ